MHAFDRTYYITFNFSILQMKSCRQHVHLIILLLIGIIVFLIFGKNETTETLEVEYRIPETIHSAPTMRSHIDHHQAKEGPLKPLVTEEQHTIRKSHKFRKTEEPKKKRSLPHKCQEDASNEDVLHRSLSYRFEDFHEIENRARTEEGKPTGKINFDR